MQEGKSGGWKELRMVLPPNVAPDEKHARCVRAFIPTI